MKKSVLEKKFIKNISLITMIILVCISVCTLAISIKLNVSSIKQSLEISLENGKNNVNSWFLEKESVLNTIADEMSLYKGDDSEKIIQSLINHKNSNDYLVDVYIGTPQNNMYCGSGWIPDSSYTVTDRDWYLGVPTDGTIKYTSTYIDADSGILVITLSRAVYDNSGNMYGVIAMDIKLDSLTQFINNETILSTSGKAFLLDNDYNVIAHNKEDFLPQIDGDTEKYTNLKDIGLKDKCFSNSIKTLLTTTKGTNGRSVFFGSAGIEKNGWKYGFEVPVSDFNGTYLKLIAQWIFIIAIMMAITIASTKKISSKLLLPIHTIIEKTKQMSLGATDIDFDINTKDELEELSHSLEDSLKSTKNQIEQIQKCIDGNLNVLVVPKSKEDKLALAVNDLIAHLKELITNIQSNSKMLMEQSEDELCRANNILSQTTNEKDIIADLIENMELISENVRENAKSSQEASEETKAAKHALEEGNQKVMVLADAMKELTNSATTINNIIKTISDIAFQTNILALNASVEAARAGQAGKGFSVVAEEVRTLAGRSAEAVKNTSALVESIVSSVEAGNALTEEAAKFINNSFDKASAVSEITESIAIAAEKQETFIENIKFAVDQISSSISDSSNIAQTNVQSSKDLSSQALNMNNSVSKFTIDKI